jgi:hypothetical protein
MATYGRGLSRKPFTASPWLHREYRSTVRGLSRSLFARDKDIADSLFLQDWIGLSSPSLLSGAALTNTAPALGPATIQQSHVLKADRLALHSRLVFEGDSITGGGATFIGPAIIASQGRYYCPIGYNSGVGGQSIQTMSTETSGITSLNPKLVVFHGGFNDIRWSEDTPATILTYLRTCIDAYKGVGAKVVVIYVLPAPAWFDAGQEARRVAFNDLIRAQTDITAIDVSAGFDPGTMTTDGVHPNWLGAIHIGNALAVTLNELIDTDTPIAHSFDASNFLIGASENPTLTGTGGNKTGSPTPTGDVADSWTVTHDDGFTVVASKTTLNGNVAQRIVVSGTNSTNGRVVKLTNSCAYNGKSGERYETWWDFSLASGSQNLRTIGALSDTTASPNPYGQVDILPSTAMAGVMRPPNVSSLGGTDTSTDIEFILTFAAGTVAADVTVAAPYFGRAEQFLNRPTLGSPSLNTYTIAAAGLTNSAPALGAPSIVSPVISVANVANDSPYLTAIPAFAKVDAGTFVASPLTNTAPALGPATIKQIHVLGAAALTNTAPALGPATIQQIHILGAATLTNSAPALGPATIQQIHVLGAAALTNSAPALGPASIAINGVMAAAALTNSAPALGPATIQQVHALSASQLANSAPSLGAPILRKVLAASNLANSAPVLGPATLVANAILSASNLSNSAPSLGAPALVAGSGLIAVNLANSAPALGPATIQQVHQLIGGFANLAPSIGAPAIGQQHVLSAANLSNASPSLPSLVVGIIGTMIAAPLANSAPILGPGQLGQIHALTASALSPAAPVLGPTALVQRILLDVSSMTNASPMIGASAFGQHHVLEGAAATNSSPELGAPQTIIGGVMAAFDLRPGSPVIGAPDFRERYTLVAGPFANGSPELGTSALRKRLTAAGISAASPNIGRPWINPRYFTRPTALKGSVDNTEELLGSVDTTIELTAGFTTGE